MLREKNRGDEYLMLIFALLKRIIYVYGTLFVASLRLFVYRLCILSCKFIPRKRILY